MHSGLDGRLLLGKVVPFLSSQRAGDQSGEDGHHRHLWASVVRAEVLMKGIDVATALGTVEACMMLRHSGGGRVVRCNCSVV